LFLEGSSPANRAEDTPHGEACDLEGNAPPVLPYATKLDPHKARSYSPEGGGIDDANPSRNLSGLLAPCG